MELLLGSFRHAFITTHTHAFTSINRPMRVVISHHLTAGAGNQHHMRYRDGHLDHKPPIDRTEPQQEVADRNQWSSAGSTTLSDSL